MKKLALLSLLLATTSLRAQLFTPESFSGAALGSLTGAIIGHNSGRHGAEGAAIGAGAGWLLGTLAHHSKRNRSAYHYSPSVSYYSSPYSSYGYSSYPYSYSYSRPYYRRPHYALTGAALGGLTGGIIGHNTDGRTAQWAAIGAGSGLLLGAIAAENAQRRETRRTRYSAPAPPPPANIAAPTQVEPTRQYILIKPVSGGSSSSMSSANSLFGR